MDNDAPVVRTLVGKAMYSFRVARTSFLDPPLDWPAATSDGEPSERVDVLSWRGTPGLMTRAHRHDDIEVNIAIGGALSYLLGGRLVHLPAGSTALFWAAVPHQLVGKGDATFVHWLTIPLVTVLRFGLPEHTIAGLLRGEPSIIAGAGRTEIPEGWFEDLVSTVPELRSAALLEVQAWLLRSTWAARQNTRAHAVGRQDVDRQLPGDIAAASSMARYISINFREPLRVDRIAQSVHLSPGHAMTVFRRAVGMTLGAYLSQCRVAEAQRLLITTRATMREVGIRCGFASQSAFYEAFHARCGHPPGAYRRRALRELRQESAFVG
ncbi:MAG: helix-turn-helix domain-containing protein [Mycobacteriales bacterium]